MQRLTKLVSKNRNKILVVLTVFFLINVSFYHRVFVVRSAVCTCVVFCCC